MTPDLGTKFTLQSAPKVEATAEPTLADGSASGKKKKEAAKQPVVVSKPKKEDRKVEEEEKEDKEKLTQKEIEELDKRLKLQEGVACSYLETRKQEEKMLGKKVGSNVERARLHRRHLDGPLGKK